MHTAWMCMDCGAVRDPGGTARLRTVSLASDPGCMALHALRERQRRCTHTGVLKEPQSGRLFIFPDLPSAHTLTSSLAALRGLPPASTPNPLTPLFRLLEAASGSVCLDRQDSRPLPSSLRAPRNAALRRRRSLCLKEL